MKFNIFKVIFPDTIMGDNCIHQMVYQHKGWIFHYSAQSHNLFKVITSANWTAFAIRHPHPATMDCLVTTGCPAESESILAGAGSAGVKLPRVAILSHYRIMAAHQTCLYKNKKNYHEIKRFKPCVHKTKWYIQSKLQGCQQSQNI